MTSRIKIVCMSSKPQIYHKKRYRPYHRTYCNQEYNSQAHCSDHNHYDDEFVLVCKADGQSGLSCIKIVEQLRKVGKRQRVLRSFLSNTEHKTLQ